MQAAFIYTVKASKFYFLRTLKMNTDEGPKLSSSIHPDPSPVPGCVLTKSLIFKLKTSLASTLTSGI